MSQSIGPGDWVEAVRSWSGNGCSIIAGMPYLIHHLTSPRFNACRCLLCGEDANSITTTFDLGDGNVDGWHPCAFRPIPPPEALVRTTETQIPLRTPLRCEPA